MTEYGYRVKEQITATAGTATFQLEAIIPAGFRAFGGEFSNNDSLPYVAVHLGDNTWEVGIGTYITATDDLQRPTNVLQNSSGTTAKINFAAGTVEIFSDVTADSLFAFSHQRDIMDVTAAGVLSMTIDASERILTGTTVPDAVGASAGSVTISTGDSGVTSINASADELIIERSTNAGITIATPNTAIGSIFFADPESNARCQIRYDHVANDLRFTVAGQLAITIDSTQRLLTGLGVPDVVGAEPGSMTISTGNSTVVTPNTAADELIIENNGDAGITFATLNDRQGSIFFADPEDDNVGMIRYDHVANDLSFTVNAALALTIDSSQNSTFGGFIAVPDGLKTAPAIRGSDTNSGIFFSNSGQDTYYARNGESRARFNNNGFTISADDWIGWSNTINADTATTDVRLHREGGGILAQRRTTIGQTFRIYNTTDGAGNLERGRVGWTSDIFRIGTEKTGTGTARAMDFTVGGTIAFTVDTTHRILTGTTVPDLVGAQSGSMTISTGDSGVTSANAQGDDLIIESAGNAGLIIATPNTATGHIIFADPQDDNVGMIRYNHSSTTDTLQIVVDGIRALSFDASSRISTGTILSDLIGAQGGSMTISTGNSGVTTADANADELIIEGTGQLGISILTPNDKKGSIVFGDPEDNNRGQILYNHTLDAMQFVVDGQLGLTIDAANRILTGVNIPDIVGTNTGSMTISTGDSGVTVPNGIADDFIIEHSNNMGMTFAAPNDKTSAIYFADPEDDNVGMIAYDHLANDLSFTVDAALALTIDATQRLLTGTAVSDLVGGEAGAITISGGDSGVTTAQSVADDLIIENNTHVGMMMATANTQDCRILFADPEDNNVGEIKYAHGVDNLSFTVNAALALTIDSTRRLLTGSPLSDLLGVAGSLTISTADSGVTTPDLEANDLLLEAGSTTGMTFAATNTGRCTIAFADPDDANVGKIVYNHNGNTLAFTVNAALALTIDSTQRILTGSPVPDLVGAAAGAITISTGNSGVTTADSSGDDLLIEAGAHCGISLMSPTNGTGRMNFGDTNDNDIGQILYTHSATAALGQMSFLAGTKISMRLVDGHLVTGGGVITDLVGAELGSVTVSTGDSGVTSPNGNSDDLVIENNGHAGITIATSNTANNNIYFADPEDNNAGMIVYNHNLDDLRFTVNAGLAFAIDSTKRFLIGPSISDAVGALAGSCTINTGNSGVTSINGSADELIMEMNGAGGITIASPNSASGNIYFADPEDNDVGKIVYNHTNDSLSFTVNAGTALAIDSSKRSRFGSGTDFLGADFSVTIATSNSGVTSVAAGANDLLIEASSDTGITIACPNTDRGNIFFADPQDNDGGQISYDHGDNTMRFVTGAVDALVMTELLATFNGNVRVDNQLRLGDNTELTVAAGVVTVTSSHHRLDTQDDDATDDLDTINGGVASAILVLMSMVDSRDVTVKNATGNILLSSDFTFADRSSSLMLMWSSTRGAWIELSRTV